MRLVICNGHGDESVLSLGEAPSPTLSAGEIRLSVTAAGINRADLLQRRGLYPPPEGASPILGLECAGRVIEVAPDIASWRPGQRAMALLAGGGYAREVVVSAGCAMSTPARLSDIEAAAVPEVFITAYLNLFQLGHLEQGETVLIHGGSGGVGTAAIQLARLAGARVLVTAGGQDRCRRCVELGAAAAFDHRSADFVSATRETTGGRGVDVVLDCMGARYLEGNLEVLASEGRLVVIGLMGGASATVNLGRVLARRLTVIGSTLRSRPPADKARIIAGFLSRFGGPLAEGLIAPVVDRVLPLEEVAEAHRLLAAGAIFGKLVLQVSEEARSSR